MNAKNDVTVHITGNDLKVIILGSELTIAMKHTGRTFKESRVALLLGVVDTQTIRRYFSSPKYPKGAKIENPVFGRVATCRELDSWKSTEHYQLFDSLRTLLGRGFQDRKAFRRLELVSIGQFGFNDEYLRELGYRMAVARMNETIRLQNESMARVVTKESRVPEVSPFKQPARPVESSDDHYESHRNTNSLLMSSIASSSNHGYSSSGDTSSSSGSDAGSSSSD